jgi:hypothetical protein
VEQFEQIRRDREREGLSVRALARKPGGLERSLPLAQERQRGAWPQFRRIIGYRDLAKLVIVIAIERRHAAQRTNTTTHATYPTAAPEVAPTAV